MATRMQQRRGTAAQWTSANPVLAAGEIGFEIDTNKFKMGDGINQWADLGYFLDETALGGSFDDYVPLTEKGAADGVATLDSNGQVPIAQLGNLISDAPEILDTLGEIATSINDVNGLVQQRIDASLEPVTQSIEDGFESTGLTITGIQGDITTLNNAVDSIESNVSTLDTNLQQAQLDIVTVTSAADALSDQVTTLEASMVAAEGDIVTIQSDITSLTGVVSANYTSLENAISDHSSDTTNVHGIADTSVLVTTTQLDTKQDKVAGVSDTEIGYLDGVTSSIQTQIDGKAATSHTHAISDVSGLESELVSKAGLSGATFTGDVTVETNLTVDGNLTVTGTTTTVSAQDLVVSDPLIYIGEGNTANLVDIGIVGNFNNGTYQHTGIVRDASADVWKLFKGVTDEPTTTVNFAQGSLDNLQLNNLTAAGIVFTDGTQTKQGVPSITPINQKTASYTTVLTDRDSLIEISSATATTLTIPTDASVAYPVGTSFDILQTGAGQVTIAGAAGVTVNATPGLKLRTQWSSATLFKRAANTWVVYGDLTA